MDPLKNAVDAGKKLLQERAREPARNWIGLMGRADGVVIDAGLSTPNQQYVYVRMPDGGTVSVYNGAVPPQADARVVVGYDDFNPSLFQVLRLAASYGGAGAPPAVTLPTHAPQHAWLGWDPLLVNIRAWSPFAVYPAGGLKVQVYSTYFWTGTVWARIASTVDLSSYVPSGVGQARYVLLEADATGTIIATAGTIGSVLALGDGSIPAPNPARRSISAVRLIAGQTAIQENQNANDLAADLRFPGTHPHTPANLGNVDPGLLGNSASAAGLITSIPLAPRLAFTAGSADLGLLTAGSGGLITWDTWGRVTGGSPGSSGSGGAPLSDAVPAPISGTAGSAGTSASAARGDHAHYNPLPALVKDPTGFTDPANVIETYDPANRTITLTGTVSAYWQGKPIPALTSGWISGSHANVNGTYYLSYDGAAFAWSTSPWTFEKLQIAYVQYSGSAGNTFAIRECHGFMAWQTHEEFHETIGAYRESGGTLSGYTPSSTTPALRRPTVAAAVIHDEDNVTTNGSAAAGNYTQMVLSGSTATNVAFTVGAAEIVPVLADNPYYNLFSAPNWTQVLMSNNSYMSVWLVAIPTTASAQSQKFRFVWMQGQSNGNLAGQQALTPANLNLGNFAALATEFVFLAQVIIRYIGGNWEITQVVNLLGNHYSQVDSPSSGALSVVAATYPLQGSGTSGDPLTLAAATAGSPGSMSAADFVKLAGIATGATKTTLYDGAIEALTATAASAANTSASAARGDHVHAIISASAGYGRTSPVLLATSASGGLNLDRLEVGNVAGAAVGTILAAGAILGVQYFCQVARAANQSLTQNNWTIVSWDTESYDTDGMFTSGSPTRITFAQAGLYFVNFQARASGGAIQLQILQGGATLIGYNGSGTVGCALSLVHYFAATDYITTQIYTTGAGATTLAPTNLAAILLSR